MKVILKQSVGGFKSGKYANHRAGDLYEVTDQAHADRLIAKGIAYMPDEAETEPAPDLSNMTVAELRTLADSVGVLHSGLLKPQLIAALELHFSAE